MKVLKNKVYHENKYEAHTCDIYLPESDNIESFPIMIFLHGGSFHTGSKEMYEEWGCFLAKNDIIVISVNYTLALPNRPSHEYVKDDLVNLFKFIVNNGNSWQADLYNIAIGGDSAGGYLASYAALNLSGSSYKIKACIPVYGVFDLAEWSNYTDTTRKDLVVKKFTGLDPKLNYYEYQKMNILNMVPQASLDPNFHTEFLVIYGLLDDVVLCENQSELFIEKLNEYNIKNKVIKIDDRGHFWFTPINEGTLLTTYPTEMVTNQVLSFLKSSFKHKNTYDIHLYEV